MTFIIPMIKASWPLCECFDGFLKQHGSDAELICSETMCGTLMASSLRNRLSAVDEAQVSRGEP